MIHHDDTVRNEDRRFKSEISNSQTILIYSNTHTGHMRISFEVQNAEIQWAGWWIQRLKLQKIRVLTINSEYFGNLALKVDQKIQTDTQWSRRQTFNNATKLSRWLLQQEMAVEWFGKDEDSRETKKTVEQVQTVGAAMAHPGWDRMLVQYLPASFKGEIVWIQLLYFFSRLIWPSLCHNTWESCKDECDWISPLET